jgi:hypothetical protein
MRLPYFAALVAIPLMTAGAWAKPAEPSAILAKALAGRTPGKPTSCINLRDIRSTRIIDSRTIIYEAGSRRLYVNHPPGGCPGLNPSRALVSRTTTTSLCSGDIIQVIDPPSSMNFGSCGLGEFTPYTK